MKLIGIFLLLPSSAMALDPMPSISHGANEERAIRAAGQALIIETGLDKYAKKMEKYITKKIEHHTGIDRDTIAWVGSTAAVFHKNEINTKIIKNLRVDIWGGTVRPDVFYNWKSKDSQGKIQMNWNF